MFGIKIIMNWTEDRQIYYLLNKLIHHVIMFGIALKIILKMDEKAQRKKRFHRFQFDYAVKSIVTGRNMENMRVNA